MGPLALPGERLGTPVTERARRREMTSALDRTSVFVSSGSSEMSAPGFLVPLIVKVGGIFVTRSRGFCDPVSRIACVEVRPGLEFRRIFVGGTHGHRSGPARVARFDTRIGSTFRRCAHCQCLHRALENVHRPAPQCELVGTVAVDLHLLGALY